VNARSRDANHKLVARALMVLLVTIAALVAYLAHSLGAFA